ncbi:MAG TPA: SRPBCC family protein [Xanthomonadaceae bacterium]|nr:SRPBCC family protein [Xanthomonadaceae bacterium]
MTRLIEILIALAIVAVLFVLVGLVLPSERHLSESIETNRKMTIVYDTLSSMRRFDDWNPVALRDIEEASITGPESGEGATYNFTSRNERFGEGSWKIIEAVPGEKIVYAVENNQRGKDKVMTITLEPTGRNDRNVKITQTYDVDYGWNILGRYEGLYVARNVGDSMELGLARLGNMLATIPNYDYAVLEEQPKIVERPAQNVIFVPSTVKRDNDVVEGQMKTNWQWIEKVMQANGLEAAGPMRIVTIEFGSENYAFEIAQPVRKAGTGPDAGGDDADAGSDAEAEGDEVAAAEGEGEDAADAGADEAPVPVVDAEPIEIALQGPVEYRMVAHHQAATVSMEGHMANLPRFRDAVRAWALTRGWETTGRPYEEWESGISQSFTNEGEFEVYWPVKQ